MARNKKGGSLCLFKTHMHRRQCNSDPQQPFPFFYVYISSRLSLYLFRCEKMAVSVLLPFVRPSILPSVVHTRGKFLINLIVFGLSLNKSHLKNRIKTNRSPERFWSSSYFLVSELRYVIFSPYFTGKRSWRASFVSRNSSVFTHPSLR